MAETEVTSDFVKALRLLHSRAKDSADVLKDMLDNVLKNKCNQSLAKIDQKKPIKAIETAVIKSSLDYKKELFDKKIRSESFEYPPDRKRSRLESPQTSRSTSSSPTPGSGLQLPLKPLSTTPPVLMEEKPSLPAVKIEEDSEATDIEDENTDAGEFAVEMGLACVQCKQIDIAPNNQLVECQECHNLYHQECHKPPLVDQDISDPRFVWYCAKCQKTMKKTIAVKPQKNNKSPVQTSTSTVTSVQSKESSNPGLKTPVKESASDSRPIQPFKREPKLSVTTSSLQSTATSAKPIGLAALANISRTGSVSSSGVQNNKPKNGNNNSGTSSAAPQTTSNVAMMASAEKRLQNLKKNKNNRQK